MSENKITTYLLYAAGEIILVVAGILIAVQIDNVNEATKERKQEIHYLTNIKSDLKTNILMMEQFLEQREGYITSAQLIIEHLEGKPITDWHAFNEHTISIYDWRRFYQVNYTFQELINSGHLSLIKNDSIKSTLLNLEALYTQTKAEEDHFRFDSEELIYKRIYELMDLHPVVKEYMTHNETLTKEMYGDYFTDKRIKNGFLMVILEFSKMNEQLNEIKEQSERLIERIDRDIERK